MARIAPPGGELRVEVDVAKALVLEDIFLTTDFADTNRIKAGVSLAWMNFNPVFIRAICG